MEVGEVLENIMLCHEAHKAKRSSASLEVGETLIAQQCPYEGGPAVYQARSLLRIIDESVEYYDDIICLQAGYFKILNSTSTDAKRITLVPNPANHFVDVYCSRFVEEMGKIWVYDSFGKCVSASETTSGTKIKQIDVSTYAPGIYLVQLEIGGELFTEKLVVIN